MPIALRSRDSSSSIISRYASLAPERRLTGSGTVASGKKPVITSLAGFELSAPVGPEKPVITSLAGFEPSEPVVTEVAAFAGGLRPQPPGVRSAIPADLLSLLTFALSADTLRLKNGRIMNGT